MLFFFFFASLTKKILCETAFVTCIVKCYIYLCVWNALSRCSAVQKHMLEYKISTLLLFSTGGISDTLQGFDLYTLRYPTSCVRGSIKFLAFCSKSCWAWRKVVFVSHQAAFPSPCKQSENEVLVCKSSNLHAHILFNFTASWVALIASRHLGPLLFKSHRRFWRCGTLCSLVFLPSRLLEVSCVITVAKIIKFTLQNKDYSIVVLNINLIASLFCGHA